MFTDKDDMTGIGDTDGAPGDGGNAKTGASFRTKRDLLDEIESLRAEVRRLDDALEMSKRSSRIIRSMDTLRTAEQQKMEKYMRLMLENIENVLLLINEEWRIVYCSAAFLRLAGIDNFSSINGKLLYDIYKMFGDETFAAEALMNLQEIKTSKQSVEVNASILFPGLRETRLYTIHTTPLLSPGGNFEGVLAIYHDTTELRRVEAEERTKAMLDATPLLASFWDEEGNILDCNLEALNLLGLSEKSEYLDNFYNLNPKYQPDGEPSMEKSAKLIRAAFETGYQKFEWTYLTSSEEPLPMETTLVRIPWKDGYRIAAYSRDLREIKDKENETRAAEDRTRAMLNAMPLACVFLRESGLAIDCNSEAPRLFHVSSKQEFLDNYYNWMPEFQPDGSRSLMKKRMLIHDAFETGYSHFEWMHQTASGEPLPAEVTLVRVEWDGSYCIAAYIRDLREIKANEQKMREADEHTRELEVQTMAAQASSEAKSSFLASMSHEIRTPMNAILGMSELMRTDNLDDVQSRYFSDIRKMSHSLLQIINDILDFSKIEAGKFALIPADYNIFSLYENVCSLMRFTIAGKSLEFRHTIADDIPAVLFGDEVRVRQIIMNIVNNAIKYTRQGYVDIEILRVEKNERDYLSISIGDTGIGIKKEDFPRIFGAFEQLDKRKNMGITGTGLGLSITKRLVDMMDGEVTFESEYGMGSIFTVLIPIVEGDPSRILKSGSEKRAVASEDVKVLVVDDNAVNLTVALGFLARHNVAPDVADGGAQAIDLVQAKKYDLILMDHMMPEIDGIEATRRIRALGGDYYGKVPIVALSANVVSSAREAFTEAGMNDFIPKPIEADKLNSVLLKWLPPDRLLDETAPIAPLAAPAEDESLLPLLEKLSHINGLDIETGLYRVDNNKTVYVSILRQFSNGLDKDIAAICAFLAEKNWKEYAVRVHAVKSVFANLGRQGLSDWALALEKAATDGDFAKCEKETEDFCDAMAVFREKLLKAGIMDGAAKKIEKRETKSGELVEMLENLTEFCLDGDPDGANEIAGELRRVKINDDVDARIAEICELVESFDYEDVIEKQKELRALL
ncbi:MAG: response regulator [Synergistaceae bacterium]|jgi:signal transduction histidine kinase/DNA-binding LytR/AlgR family response regulator|nr:response regulator [Synergistaceae bacterium]